MHRLAYSFVLGYHGCDKKVAARLLDGDDFKLSHNDYDWLGDGIYFWEANPIRGLEYATELKNLKRGPKISTPCVVGAVIDLGLCLDLTTSAGVQHVQNAYKRFLEITETAKSPLPKNSSDQMRRDLDCAVIHVLHQVRKRSGDLKLIQFEVYSRRVSPHSTVPGFMPRRISRFVSATRNASKACFEFQRIS